MKTIEDNKALYASLVGLAAKRGLVLKKTATGQEQWDNGNVVDMILTIPGKFESRVIEKTSSLTWMHERIKAFKLV